jgi:hypothetical protein
MHKPAPGPPKLCQHLSLSNTLFFALHPINFHTDEAEQSCWAGWTSKSPHKSSHQHFSFFEVLKPKTQNPKPYILRKSVDTAEEIILCLLVVSSTFLTRYSYFADT